MLKRSPPQPAIASLSPECRKSISAIESLATVLQFLPPIDVEEPQVVAAQLYAGMGFQLVLDRFPAARPSLLNGPREADECCSEQAPG